MLVIPLQNILSFLVPLVLLMCGFLEKRFIKFRCQSIHTRLQITFTNLTYFHPTMDPQPTQKISETVCIPVIIMRSSFTPGVTLTLNTTYTSE
jgi:hypothetical protein